MADEKKKITVPRGLAGSIEGIEREVPRSEPPPLPPNSELRVVGRKVPRLDGRAKVTGAARYTADVRLPGMLHARMIGSPHPHARIRSVEVRAAAALPGVRAVHVIEHLLGSAVLRDPSGEAPSRWPIIRYAGQPVAAVAAVSQAIADEAAKLVEIEYEVLPFVVDEDLARRPGAPLVFPGPADQAGTAGGGGGPAGVPQEGNVRGPAVGGEGPRPKGDVRRGFDEADLVVEGEFRTQVQTHSAMETHGVVADWTAEGLTVWASTQGTMGVRDELAEIFDLPLSGVRVVTEYMGGGFGAKFGAGNYGVVATHLSKKAGAPVRLMLDRRDEHLSVGNRPSSRQKLRIGGKRDGTITAIHLQSWGTAGVGTGAGAAGPAQNMYEVPNIRTEEWDVFTNAGPAAAFRAPGHPQGCFALEQSIDELAERLGMDPLALRDLNDANSARRAERRIGAEKFGWSRRAAPGASPGAIKRGVGVAQSVWYRLVAMDSAAEVRILGDGSVEVRSAVQDIGTGIRTILAQVVAEELGIEPADVRVHIGDTAFPPGPQSGGSMTTGSITPAVRNAAWDARTRMIERLAGALGVGEEAIEWSGGRVRVAGEKPREMSFAEAARAMRTREVSGRASRSEDYGGFRFPGGGTRVGIGTLGGVQFAEVSVDTGTGVIRVERMLAVHDCGRPMNLLSLESQINGGIIQGISYALYEQRLLDSNSGIMVNPNLEQYKIAGSRETPPIEIVVLEEYSGVSSTDALGIGEPATIPTAAAVANAVYNAIGVRIRELPMTPARVLAALEGRRA
ncbi:MAG TPA: xanthine dehydrogenase family protein molybdopterin-binding subunit [Thermoanaerobaculia bacterium]|nr:xanthine dehydrogenase family protein molybdopterin-binding subunit [Thermoanaerobaculia bacterium]